MVTYLGSLVQLCCGGGGHCKQISLVCVGGSSQCMDHIRLAPAHGSGVCFPVYTARAPGCSAGVLSKANPAFMHFPGLNCSGSGSWALRMGTDSVGCAFRALPRSEQLRWPGACQRHCPRWAVHLNHLPSPGGSVSQVCQESTISGVPCVSPGELISSCDPPGRCQPSRIPGRHS